MQVLDRVTTKGNRSRLISDAILHYVAAQGKNQLAERLKAGAIANADRDLGIAEEWFPPEEDGWQGRQEPARKGRKIGPPQRGDFYPVNFDPTLARKRCGGWTGPFEPALDWWTFSA